MCLPGTSRLVRTTAAAAALGAMLAGCSDPGLYLDRRDTIALSGGDTVAANAVEQMVDPWPRTSGNTNIAFNGQRMQSAVERYRGDAITPPVDPMAMQVATPSSTTNQNGSSQNNNNPGGSATPAGGSSTTAGTSGQ